MIDEGVELVVGCDHQRDAVTYCAVSGGDGVRRDGHEESDTGEVGPLRQTDMSDFDAVGARSCVESNRGATRRRLGSF